MQVNCVCVCVQKTIWPFQGPCWRFWRTYGEQWSTAFLHWKGNRILYKGILFEHFAGRWVRTAGYQGLTLVSTGLTFHRTRYSSTFGEFCRFSFRCLYFNLFRAMSSWLRNWLLPSRRRRALARNNFPDFKKSSNCDRWHTTRIRGLMDHDTPGFLWMDFLGALCDGVRIVMGWVGNSQEGSLQPSHILILMQLMIPIITKINLILDIQLFLSKRGEVWVGDESSATGIK